MDTKVGEVDTKVGELDRKVDTKVGALDKKVEALDTKFDTMQKNSIWTLVCRSLQCCRSIPSVLLSMGTSLNAVVFASSTSYSSYSPGSSSGFDGYQFQPDENENEIEMR